MIRRITLKSGEIKEVEYYTQSDSWFKKGEIAKIEKQVKDLTLEECEKMNIVKGIWENTYFHRKIENGKVEIIKEYHLDDYIDITDIVKGGIKQE